MTCRWCARATLPRRAGLDGLGTRWAYHGTLRSDLPAIQRAGLRPGAGDDSARGVGDGRPVLFFADSTYFANTFPLDVDADEKVVLRFPWPADGRAYAKTGEVETARDGVEYNIDEYVTFRRVAPELIEVAAGGAWAPLVSLGLDGLGTREVALERFKEAVVAVWGKWPPELVVDVSQQPPRGTVYAAIAFAGKTYAVGRHLIQYPRAATLFLADAFFQLDDAQAYRVLLHEAVHLGYPGHGKDFRDVAREVGAAVSGSAATEGNIVKVQKKVGARYQTVKTFESEREALAWGKEQARLEPSSRWRLSM